MAAIALVLWTPLRVWLRIRPAKDGRPQEHEITSVMTGGVRNHPGARSTHVRSHFKGVGIENMPSNAEKRGGESYDQDSTFE